jgi:D-alanyl-D-alanine carboxypeptidase
LGVVRVDAVRAIGVLLVLSCATGGAPPPGAPTAQRERLEPDGGAPPVVTAPVVEAEPPLAPAETLPWVNPARCLSPCDYDPGASLVRVDEHGAPDEHGLHRLAESARGPLQALLAAAAAAGHPLVINSAYRSYDDQARIFRETKQPGRAAPPGQSEHQLGTAIDLKLPTPDAADWLAAHAAEFGFARSYPPGKQKITGYRPEPWHVRFVGPALAGQLGETTLEELFRARPELGASGSCQDCPARAPRKPCGRITAGGTCKGVLLSWCYEGALATVDCSAFEKRCVATGEGAHDCR